MASQVVLVVRNSPANAGDLKDEGLDPWVGKIPWRKKWKPTAAFLPGESHGGAWLATVHGVTKSWTRLKRLSTHAPKSMLRTATSNRVTGAGGSVTGPRPQPGSLLLQGLPPHMETQRGNVTGLRSPSRSQAELGKGPQPRSPPPWVSQKAAVSPPSWLPQARASPDAATRGL